jgi:hypothetical protein
MEGLLENYEMLRHLFERFCDEESRILFLNRLEWSLRQQEQYSKNDVFTPSYSSCPEKENAQWTNSFIEKANEFINQDYIRLGKEAVMFCDFLRNYKEKGDGDVIVYGTGETANKIIPVLESFGIKIKFLCDSNKDKQGKIIHGINVISPEMLKLQFSSSIVIISTILYTDEIYDYLIGMGIDGKQIVVLARYGDQYFSMPFLNT